MDTVDARFAGAVAGQRRAGAGRQRKPDYLVVQHMEPDHSANIDSFREGLSRTHRGGGLAKTFAMMEQFFGTDLCRPPSGGEATATR